MVVGWLAALDAGSLTALQEFHAVRAPKFTAVAASAHLTRPQDKTEDDGADTITVHVMACSGLRRCGEWPGVRSTAVHKRRSAFR